MSKRPARSTTIQEVLNIYETLIREYELKGRDTTRLRTRYGQYIEKFKATAKRSDIGLKRT